MADNPCPTSVYDRLRRRGSTHVWTTAEILALPESGDWFFGVVVERRRWRVVEIFPGYGYVPTLPRPWWNPMSWRWLFADVFRTPVRKARDAG